MTRPQILTACFLAGLLLLLYQIVVIFQPFLFPILWALILAHVTLPLHTRLTSLLRGRATLSAALVTLAIMSLVVAPVVLFTFLLVQEAGSAYIEVNDWVQSGGVKRLPQDLALLPFGGLIQEAIGRLVVNQDDIEAFFLQSAKSVSLFMVQQFTSLAKNAFLLAANFLVMIVTLFFVFKDGPRLFQNFYRIVPLQDSHKKKIFSRLDTTVTAVVKGVVITAIVQGILAGAAYGLLGVPFPVFLMALTILLAPLPFGGTALIWGPVVLYLYWVGPVWKAVAMLVWGAGVVTTIDNILKPFLIGRGTQLPVLFLFFSILGGIAAYGLIGLFLGPILLAILMTAMQIYREEYLTEPPPASQKGST